jgi:hypothetical protein
MPNVSRPDDGFMKLVKSRLSTIAARQHAARQAHPTLLRRSPARAAQDPETRSRQHEPSKTMPGGKGMLGGLGMLMVMARRRSKRVTHAANSASLLAT